MHSNFDSPVEAATSSVEPDLLLMPAVAADEVATKLRRLPIVERELAEAKQVNMEMQLEINMLLGKSPTKH